MPQAAVEMSRKYRHVLWYSLFVGAYMVVLWFQVSASMRILCACVRV